MPIRDRYSYSPSGRPAFTPVIRTMQGAKLQTTCLVDDKLRQTVKFMRMNGLLRLKSGDLELELHPQALNMRPKRSPEAGDDKPTGPQYSDMDILLWSAPGMSLPEDEGADG